MGVVSCPGLRAPYIVSRGHTGSCHVDEGVQMTEHTLRRKGIAVLGAVALSTGALLASGTAALAAPPVPGNIDEDATTSLTIHKYAVQDAGAGVGSPSGDPDPGFSDPIEGVVFTAYPLRDGDGDLVDLLTHDGWVGLEDAVFDGTTCAAPAGYTIDLDEGIEFEATGADGQATAPLDIGAYVICETEAPQTVTKRAAPFLITLPFPSNDGTADEGWIYEVHAYPKNEVSEFGKDIVEQDGLGIGAPVDFTITSAIPDIGDRVWEHFAITDTLDPRLAAGDPAATVVSPAGAPVSITTDAVGESDRVIVTFTDNDWLAANAGAPIEITIHSTVTSVGDGSIENTAQQWVNNPDLDASDTENPPTTTPEVTTNWGSIELLKIAADDDETTLEGAVFEVYAAAVPYPATAAECAIASEGNAIAINGSTDIVSGSDGRISIAGLFVSDSKNDPVDAQFRCYVLVEKQAPAGFVTPTGDDARTAIAVNIGQNAAHGYGPIVNAQQEVPELPLTGANGQLLLILTAVAAGTIVTGLVLVNRRRQAAAAE